MIVVLFFKMTAWRGHGFTCLTVRSKPHFERRFVPKHQLNVYFECGLAL